MVPGALSVMTTGTSVMQRSSVDSWDLLEHQAQRALLTLAVDLVRYSLTTEGPCAVHLTCAQRMGPFLGDCRTYACILEQSP